MGVPASPAYHHSEHVVPAQHGEHELTGSLQRGDQLARAAHLHAVDRYDQIAGPQPMRPPRAAAGHLYDRNGFRAAIALRVADSDASQFGNRLAARTRGFTADVQNIGALLFEILFEDAIPPTRREAESCLSVLRVRQLMNRHEAVERELQSEAAKNKGAPPKILQLQSSKQALLDQAQALVTAQEIEQKETGQQEADPVLEEIRAMIERSNRTLG